jgi:hypothetical protein
LYGDFSAYGMLSAIKEHILANINPNADIRLLWAGDEG